MDNTATRWITKKPCKDCGVRTSVLTTVNPYNSRPVAGPAYTDVFDVNSYMCVLCRGCNRPKIAQAVVGKVSKVHTCGARCLASHGPSCECSCGGKNHGAGYAAP